MKTIGTMTLLLVGMWTSFLWSSGVQPAAQEKYDSPYAVAFSYPKAELLAGFQGRRGDPRQSSIVPFADWYSAHTRKQYGHWGPPARHFQAPQSIAGRSLEWQRERVIAVASRFIGYGYQHHHIPDWDPPAGWPWAKTATGHNGKGVDCSNFTAFVYNVGFGIKPSSAIGKQAERLEIPGPGRAIRAKRIDLAGDYDASVKTLRTGDLLFIRNRKPPSVSPKPSLALPARRRDLGRQLTQLDAEPTFVPTVVKVVLAFWPTVVIAARQTTMIKASITAYSTAVGPSSAWKNRTTAS